MQHNISTLCKQVHQYIDDSHPIEKPPVNQVSADDPSASFEIETTPQNECSMEVKTDNMWLKEVSDTHLRDHDTFDDLPQAYPSKRDDGCEVKEQESHNSKSLLTQLSSQHSAENILNYSLGVTSVECTPTTITPRAPSLNASTSNAESSLFVLDKQQQVGCDLEAGDLDKSVLPEMMNFVDTGQDTSCGLMPIRSSTPQHVARVQGEASINTAKSVRRKRSSRNRSRKKSRISPSAEQMSAKSYTPSLWGLVTNVMGWYSGKPPTSSENKLSSLQISID